MDMVNDSSHYHGRNGPIFIGGLSFSGKTLLRLSLSSHPNIALTRRTYMWPRFYRQYGDLAQPGNFERCLEAMLNYKPIRALEPDPDRIRREFWLGLPTYSRLFALVHEHFAQKMGKRRWGAQIGSLENYADPIFVAYPTARMIHMIRDPRDRFQDFPLKHRQRTGKVGWATAEWLHSAALAKRNLERYANRYRMVSFEDLRTQRELVLRQISAFLDEDFVPEMLTMERAIRFGDKGSAAESDAVGSHASEQSSNQPTPEINSQRNLAFTQTYARRQIIDFGYSLRPVHFSLRNRLLFNLVDRPANLASMVACRTLQTVRL